MDTDNDYQEAGVKFGLVMAPFMMLLIASMILGAYPSSNEMSQDVSRQNQQKVTFALNNM